MAVHIRFRPTTEMPTGSRAREAERLALADRECLRLRFGEPCDPRQLREFYDVVDLVETFTDYARFLQQPVDAAAAQLAGLDGWSGFTISRTQWEHVILVNPCHARVRRTLTIAHEFGHLVHGHRPLYVSHLGGCLAETRFSDAQELEANSYALALLLPYAPLTQLLDQGATLAAIAFHYGVSVEAVEMRLKLVGLWSTRTRR